MVSVRGHGAWPVIDNVLQCRRFLNMLNTPLSERHRRCVLVLALAIASRAAGAVADPAPADLSFDELSRVQVMTVSRKAEALQDVASAAFVITGDDIRRSGATSIPEALGLAPGVDVAKIANNKWAVSIRGFNGRFANKLLVMMDGRSIYNSTFSGVWWENEDTLLEDIDRIEVIRGPGAAMWGSNAVNGVINIVTKKTRDTQGVLLTGTSGSQEGQGGAMRIGGELAPDIDYRVWGKSFDRKASAGMDGSAAYDTWRSRRAGLRVDRQMGAAGHDTLIANAWTSDAGDLRIVPLPMAPYALPLPLVQQGQGSNFLLRRERVLADGGEVQAQTYYARSSIFVSGFTDDQEVFDLDVQYRPRWHRKHDLMFGAGYRYAGQESLAVSSNIVLRPVWQRTELGSAFVQDEIDLLPDSLKAILGLRLENQSRAGWTVQPDLRLRWIPASGQTLWAAFSRAARTPSSIEDGGQLNLGVVPPGQKYNSDPARAQLNLMNNAGQPFGSERVSAWQLGYRREWSPQFSMDLAAYANHYDHLRGESPLGAAVPQVTASGVPYLLQLLTFDNSLSAWTKGLELSAEWRPYAWWRLQGNAAWGRIVVSGPANALSLDYQASLEGSSPRNTQSLRSSWDLPERQRLDLWLRRVGALAYLGIPAYSELDLRYAWKPRPDMEVSVVGQNLLGARHVEFVTDLVPSQVTAMARNVYFRMDWRY